MKLHLQFFLLLLLLFQLLLIIRTLKNKKLSMRYGSFWIFLLLLMFPSILFKISSIVGFEVASNMIFLIGFFFLFYIIFILTISISVQNEKIKLLIQELSLLKESVNNGKKE